MKFKRALADALHLRMPRLANVLSIFWGYLLPPKKSYSLYGEDLIVANFFGELKKKGAGVYVDIGAFHPKWISNTYKLAKAGWRGFVVDLDESKLFGFGVRKNCWVKCGAVVPVSYSRDTVTIYKFRRMHSEWDTTSLEDAEIMRKKYGVDFDACEVPAIRVDDLLHEAVNTLHGPVDYLNIDVEGADEEIIKGVNLVDYGVSVIQFENNKDFKGSFTLQNYLAAQNFVHLATVGGTHTYVSKQTLKQRYPSLG